MFITFEGIGGTGKTTQITKLREYLEKLGRTVVVTREPGGSQLGIELRARLLTEKEEPLAPMAELLLFMADRAEHVAKVIQPALAAGKIVISDRFMDSSTAYQAGGHGLPLDTVRQLNGIAAMGTIPDLTILLDMAPTAALKRARQRDQATDKGKTEGRFTAQALSFHRRVREEYLSEATYWNTLFSTRRFCVIDASADAGGVHRHVRARVAERLLRGD